MEQEVQAVQQEQAVETEKQQETKTYTQAEVDALLQSETDRRVRHAVEKNKAKMEQELKAKMEAERAEAEKLSKLSADERAEHERKKMNDAFEKERAEFMEQKKAFEMQKLELELVKTLESEKLPVAFSKFLLGADAESTHENLQAFKEVFNMEVQRAVEAQVQNALRGKEPSGAVESKAMTKQEFLQLPYSKRSQMLQENPEFVNELLKS